MSSKKFTTCEEIELSMRKCMGTNPKERLEEVRGLLKKEEGIPLIPILHNKKVIYLQSGSLIGGWSINLYSDGTWVWEDTSGG